MTLVALTGPIAAEGNLPSDHRPLARDHRGAPRARGTEAMTPFMLRVQARLDGEPAPPADTIESRPVSRPVAADAQMMVRALAEQLISEANSILREQGEVLRLEDRVGPGELTFTLAYRDRAARIQTVLAGRQAEVRLIIDGRVEDTPRQLSDQDQLQDLVLSLIDTAPTHSTIR